MSRCGSTTTALALAGPLSRETDDGVFGLEEPGYGFVDEQTPELAIAVVPSKRGHGIGDELLQELIAKARDAGYQRLSLSVEPGNPARKLYERHGFSVVDEGAEAWTMIASL